MHSSQPLRRLCLEANLSRFTDQPKPERFFRALQNSQNLIDELVQRQILAWELDTEIQAALLEAEETDNKIRS